MKKRRIIFAFVLFVLIFLLLFLSSPFFSFNSVTLSLFERVDSIRVVKVKDDFYGCSFNYVSNDFGKSIFKIDKNSYIRPFEEENPEYKVLAVNVRFPNKIVFDIVLRKETFCILSKDFRFVLDEEFKVLKKEKLSQNFNLLENNLIEINGQNEEGSCINFFDFFELTEAFCFEGYFLDENNILVEKIKNFCAILLDCGVEYNTFLSISFQEKNDSVNLVCKTNKEYGVEIVVKNIFENFDKKFLIGIEKFLFFLKTEKIKTTYGKIIVDDDFCCTFLGQ